MPSKSQKQHNAMAAAAAGKGTLGIPPSVAREFLSADKAAGKYRKSKKKAKRSPRNLAEAVTG